MNNILEKIKNTRLLAGIGIISLFLGTILPYISYKSWLGNISLSLWGYWEGKIILVLVIANLIFIFRDIVEKYVPKLFDTKIGMKIKNINNPKASLVPTILATILAIYLHTQLDFGFENYGLGFYLLWIGVISLVAYAFINKNNIQS